jgi:hypothetical protein
VSLPFSVTCKVAPQRIFRGPASAGAGVDPSRHLLKQTVCVPMFDNVRETRTGCDFFRVQLELASGAAAQNFLPPARTGAGVDRCVTWSSLKLCCVNVD